MFPMQWREGGIRNLKLVAAARILFPLQWHPCPHIFNPAREGVKKRLYNSQADCGGRESSA